MTARTWQDAFIREPGRIAIGQPHQVLISGMPITLTAAFFYDALHKLAFLPWQLAVLVSVGVAVGAEYAYLKGLADGARTQAAQQGERSTWQRRLITTAAMLNGIAGMTVLLTHAYKLSWLVEPHPAVAALLTLAHIAPLVYLGLCSANLHAEVETAEAARVRAIQEAQEARQRERDAEEQARKQRRTAYEDAAYARRLEAETEQANEDAKLRRWQEAQVFKASVRANAQTRTDDARTDPHAAAQSAARAMTKAELYAAVRAAYAENPAFSRADLARRAGWSEAMVRKAIKEVDSAN